MKRVVAITFVACLAVLFTAALSHARISMIPGIKVWTIGAVPDTGAALDALDKDWLAEKTGQDEPTTATVENGPKPGDKLTGYPDFDWKLVEYGSDLIDLDDVFQPDVDNNNITAYMVVYINSDSDKTLDLYIGSDDAVAVWINGEEVHRNPVLRGAARDQDKIEGVQLKKGWNCLMLKVCEQGGGWKGFARFSDHTGLKFSPDMSKIYEPEPPIDYISDFLAIALPNPSPGAAVEACNTDLIAEATGGALTEVDVATYGVDRGDRVGDAVWTEGSFKNLGGNNVNDFVTEYLGFSGDVNDTTAYFFTNILSPDERDTQLLVGSDDCVVVWLNGEEVWRNPALRGLTPDQDVIDIHLKKGYNPLLIKVSEQGGDRALTVRIKDAEGLEFDSTVTPVSPKDKLITIWGEIKGGK
ncbi:hypothetical protein DRP77_07120 [Candidatus Poribacteria bacterium]|nr:MAG: hypothetical protein DRP77_07120 [Candidatus Poribacteria bacterium]